MKQIADLIQQETREIEFNDFYSAYPKRVNRVRAEKVWDSITDKEKHLALTDIPHRLENHHQWRDKQYIPAPDVYLRNKMWTDEIIRKRTRANEQQEKEDGSDLARLWTLLEQMYGERWIRAYGDTIPYMWKAKLHDVTKKEIAKIINELLTDGSEFLPDLPKIMRLKRIGVTESTFKSLPKPQTDMAVVKASIKEMKTILRGKRNDSNDIE